MNTGSTDLPKMVGMDDYQVVLAEGADALAMMILQGLIENELPPPDILKWYTQYATLRFIEAEYNAIYKDEQSTDESRRELMVLQTGLRELRKLLDSNKQYGLSHDIQQLLKRRMLHLPERYAGLLDQTTLMP